MLAPLQSVMLYSGLLTDLANTRLSLTVNFLTLFKVVSSAIY